MIDAMKSKVQLEGMLSVLGAGMNLASRVNRGFQQTLAEKDGIAEIRTEDRSVARKFCISHGKIRIERGPHPNPDYAIVYKDAPMAVETMKKGPEGSLQAMSEGTMRFEGDLTFGMWFNELLQNIGNLLQNPKELITL